MKEKSSPPQGAIKPSTQNLIEFFHHKRYTESMKVVEKDKHIHGMLQEELKRCRDMIISLQKELSNLPAGTIHKRRKQYKGKKYVYHYLKYRQGGMSISKHLPEKEVEKYIQQLQLRNQYEKEKNFYAARVKYLEKISKA
jgi:hypothetical protein